MISRRNFLKYSGMAIAAAGAGFSTGKLTGSRQEKDYFVVQGFLPEDENTITSLFKTVKQKIAASGDPVIIASGISTLNLKKITDEQIQKNGSGKLVIRINRLDKKVPADILISDNNNYIYDPASDYTVMAAGLREQLRTKTADLFISIEHCNTGLISSLFNMNNKTAVLHNQNGIAEIINLEKDYNRIVIKGSQGNTVAEIKNGMIRVTDSCCRNKICTHSGSHMSAGSIIACAPNKVLIKIENA